ncbi:MT-A70 family methyltransferase [Burkholderia gladioli]|uniref:MT-A70 family methyltransferase n=1 Tax=Burkholderia gladioli TaxID=28095 RepID=UPI00163E078B|nr:MT-A70 family methyltransferase [Burkholderia gladioli]
MSSDSVLRAKTVAASGCDTLISKVAEGAIPVSVAEKLVKAAKGDSSLLERMVESGIGRVHREMYKYEVLKLKRERAKQLVANNPVAAHQLTDFAEGSFQVIQADFPWRYTESSAGMADPSHHYPTMSLDEIKAMPIGRLAADDSVFFMWCVNSMLPEALDVMKHFGFNYVHNIVWAKDSHVIGNGAVINRHEILLVGRRGLALHQPGVKKIPSWYATEGQRFAHSEKPAWFSEQIDRVYGDCTKLELFARAPRAGWATWGNELVLPEAPNLDTVANVGDEVASNDETFERAV